MKKYQSFLGENKMIKDQGLLRHEDIRRKIRVLPELEELIPPLLTDEYTQLETNLLREGCREALIVWEVGASEAEVSQGEYVLIDGHNRYRICSKHGLDFRINLASFDSMTDVREYMIDNQLGRRNLSPEQISYLRGKKYNSQKLSRGKYERSEHKGQNVPYESGVSTADRLAAQFNVSQKTIKRDAEFATGLDKLPAEQRKDVLSGKLKMRKSDIQALTKEEKKVSKPSSKKQPHREPEITRYEPMIEKINSLAKQLESQKGPTLPMCDELIEAVTQLRKKIQNTP